MLRRNLHAALSTALDSGDLRLRPACFEQRSDHYLTERACTEQGD